MRSFRLCIQTSAKTNQLENQNNENDEELPHKFFYHHRHALLQYAKTEGLEIPNKITELLQYLESSKGSIYKEADTLFA